MNPLRRAVQVDGPILSSFLLFGAVPTSQGAEDDPPALIELTGVIRDFRERSDQNGHTDFEVTPSHGFGVYSGNIDHLLGVDGKPNFTGNGRKVTSPARDGQGRPIAPHLANHRFTSGGLENGCTLLKDANGVEAYEVCVVDAFFNGDGTSTWTYHVRELGIGKDLSHWNLLLEPVHQVVAQGTTPGYDFGLDGSTGFYGIKWDVTQNFTEGDFTVVLDGYWLGDMDCNGVLVKGGNKDDRDEMFVPTEDPSAGGSPFPSGPTLVPDAGLGDTEAHGSNPSSGGIESESSFDQWYRDILGVNLSKAFPITLVRQVNGFYVFDADESPLAAGGFFPIDDQLFGNSAGTPGHNFHFTFELHTEFTYDAAAGQIFRFIGDDDVWVFIDGKLAIDLGGVHGSTEQVVSLDRLGLTDGQTHTLDFFSAERHRTESSFRIETNIVLRDASVDGVSAILVTAAFD